MAWIPESYLDLLKDETKAFGMPGDIDERWLTSSYTNLVQY